MIKKLAALALVAAACTGTGESLDASQQPDLPTVTVEEFESHLAQVGRPAVVNVWASWCLPCRSEAPLLNVAFVQYGDQVEFIGIDVQDNQADAKAFLAEFGLDFQHFFDRNRAIPNSYGGIGTPITMFFSAEGELVTIHNGIVDDRTLALNIDEILVASD